MRERIFRYSRTCTVALALLSGGCPRSDPPDRATPSGTADPSAGTAKGHGGSAADEARRKAEQVRREALLKSIPYLGAVPLKEEERQKRGTTLHRRGQASPGYNLSIRKPGFRATLEDLDGKTVHEWSSNFGQPHALEKEYLPDVLAGWQHVHLLDNGNLLAIVPRSFLICLDWRSRLVWKVMLSAHHDIDAVEGGEIYTIDDSFRQLTAGGRKRIFVDNGLVVLSAEGIMQRRISVYDLFKNHSRARAALQKKMADLDGLYAAVAEGGARRRVSEKLAAVRKNAEAMGQPLPRLDEAALAAQVEALMSDPDRLLALPRDKMFLVHTFLESLDLLHTNSIQVIRHEVPGMWKKGDLLISVRELDLVAVVDALGRKVLWSWGPGEILRQHHPTLLPSGNILLFDNGTKDLRAESRVLEVDPRSNKIVWEYPGSKGKKFFNVSMGAGQRLGNDNILITDSYDRAFEVTRSFETVWEYYAPDIDEETSRRWTIYRMIRYEKAMVDRLLAQHRTKAVQE